MEALGVVFVIGLIVGLYIGYKEGKDMNEYQGRT